MYIRKGEINGPEIIHAENGAPTAGVRYWFNVESKTGKVQKVNILSTYETRVALGEVVSDPDSRMRQLLEEYVVQKLAAGWDPDDEPEMGPTTYEILELQKKRSRTERK